MLHQYFDDLDLRILGILQRDSSISNQELAERALASPPTCMRRVRRLKEMGVIKREIAVLDNSKIGMSVTAIIEITLDRQAAEDYARFEAYINAESPVTQCYRVSPGPDFILIADLTDMAAYDEFARRVFVSSSNVRNIRTFFSMHCAKFDANASVDLLPSYAER